MERVFIKLILLYSLKQQKITMKKLKVGVLMVTVLLMANLSKAQSIEEGREFLYYEKFISAKNVFQKLVDANPNNIDAVYWLGQTLIAPQDDKDIAGAKALYQKTLMANSNSPLLIAGMGHIQLLEGNTQDARNQFETAISLSQGKNVAVLNAVGFANADYDSKLGDAGYAIEKLKQAVAIKAGSKDPDIWCNLGDAYRKLADGGSAQQSYESALSFKPNYARAKYRNGRIYQTQGDVQKEIVLKYYNEAIAMDANYTPVYWTLFDYFYRTDVGRSAEYLDKYLTAKGSDEPNACFLRAQMKYAQGLFQDAIQKADECIAAGGASPYPNLYGIKAYAYYKLGDSLNAKASFDLYFNNQKPNKIGPLDYKTYAEVLQKFPGNETLAGTFVDKAVELDSTEEGKVSFLKSQAAMYESRKSFKDAGDWYKKVLYVKKNVSKTDLYNVGYSYFRSGNFELSNEIFCNQYAQKFPDDIFGYYMCGKGNWGIDTTMTLGLANPSFEKAIAIGEAMPDKSKIKNQLMGSYKYMIAYYANVKKDKVIAISYCDKALLVDPADQETITNKDVISKMSNTPAPATRPANTRPSGTTKPTGGNAAATETKANNTKPVSGKKK